MTKKIIRSDTQTDKAMIEAMRLVASAYATLMKSGHKNAVDGLAIACTKVILGDGACVIPVTVKSLKKHHSNPDAPSKHLNRNIRAEMISAIFDQRKDAALALVDGIKSLDETCIPVVVSFKD